MIRVVGRAASGLALAMVLSAGPAAAEPQDADESIVQLHVTKQVRMPASPWQSQTSRQESNLAVAVGEGRFLTTAWAVADAAYLQLQRFGDGRRREAKVVFVDYEVNLALVRPVQPDGFTGITPLPLSDEVSLGQQVAIYRAQSIYQLSRLPATLQEVGLYNAATSQHSQISFLLKVQQSGLGWSEPVVKDGALVALTSGSDESLVHAIPAMLISHFLADRLDEGYRGFPAIGVALSPLISPDMRQLLGADSVDHGIRVAAVSSTPGLAADLRVNDVILAIDGVKISAQGLVPHPRWGRLHLKYLINRKFGGDTCTLTVLRQGRRMEISGPLRRFQSNSARVTGYNYDTTPPHLVFGGLVFLELSREFLQDWGKNWASMAPVQLLRELEFRNDPGPDRSPRVVILARVLADEFNRGYGDLAYDPVESVNGRRIGTIVELDQALRAPVGHLGRQFARINLGLGAGEVILDHEGLAAAQARIGKRYDVPASSFFRPEPGAPATP